MNAKTPELVARMEVEPGELCLRKNFWEIPSAPYRLKGSRVAELRSHLASGVSGVVLNGTDGPEQDFGAVNWEVVQSRLRGLTTLPHSDTNLRVLHCPADAERADPTVFVQRAFAVEAWLRHGETLASCLDDDNADSLKRRLETLAKAAEQALYSGSQQADITGQATRDLAWFFRDLSRFPEGALNAFHADMYEELEPVSVVVNWEPGMHVIIAARDFHFRACANPEKMENRGALRTRMVRLS